jgi:hypothetical protein
LGTLGLAVTLLKWRTSSVLRSKGWVNIDGVLLLLLLFLLLLLLRLLFLLFPVFIEVANVDFDRLYLVDGGLDDARLVCATLFFLKSIAPNSATRDEVVIIIMVFSKRSKL